MSKLHDRRLPPLNKRGATSLVILLHGYGADGKDLLSLADHWKDALPSTEFIAPDAAVLPVLFVKDGGVIVSVVNWRVTLR